MKGSRAFRQNLSTNSLFHFTDKIEYLIDIIKNGFQARYCHENIPFGKIPFAFPMKCFCDIPLGQIKYHLKNYGTYGIGITKNFAKKKGITPIIYVHDKSSTLLAYAEEYDFDLNNLPHHESIMTSLIPYFKRYDRNTHIGDGKHKYDRFYDEREWRYIPDDSDYIYLGNEEKGDYEKVIKEKNDKLKDDEYRIPLTSHSIITYIIVEKESEKSLIINEIKKKFNSEVIQDKLISKLLSTYRISRDF